MEQGYSDITLVDCNRMNSEEGKAQNLTQPAQFTNKCGTGIKLNVGDKISIHSGFISERGAGGETIEFDAKSTGKTYNLSATSHQYSQQVFSTQAGANEPDGTGALGYNKSQHAYNPLGEVGENNSLCLRVSNTSTTYEVKDTEANFNVSYYKSSNGEGYFHLPRRYSQFTGDGEGAHTTAGLRPYLYTDTDSHNDDNTEKWFQWLTGTDEATDPTKPYPDCYRLGQTIPLFIGQNVNLLAGGGAAAKKLKGAREQPSAVVNDDVHFRNKWDNTPTALMKDGTGGTYMTQHIDNCFLYGEAGNDPEGDPQKCDYGSFLGYRYRNNNTRYTLYQKEVVYSAYAQAGQVIIPEVINLNAQWDKDVVDPIQPEIPNTTASRKDYTLMAGDQTFHRDPALSEYVKYTETKKITLKKGFTAPANVADDITNQLNANTGNDLDIDTRQTGMVFSSSIPNAITGTKSTECFKTFRCANSITAQRTNYMAYSGKHGLLPTAASIDAGATTTEAAQVIDYLSSYATIGVKRPELWETGRDVCKNCYTRQIGEGVDIAGELSSGKYAWMDIIYPEILVSILYSSAATADIITNIEWTADNLTKMKAWFDAQGKYPELFSHISFTNIGASASYKNEGHNVNNTRFLHINTANEGWGNGSFAGIYPCGANMINGKHLGGDNYYEGSLDEGNGLHEPPCSQQSRPVFVYHDSSRVNVLSGGDNKDCLWGGYFMKYLHTDGNYYFSFNVNMLGGLPDYLWTNLDNGDSNGNAATIAGTDVIVAGRTIGSDPHFSAYGTDVICLFAGYLNGDAMESVSGTFEVAEYYCLDGGNVGSPTQNPVPVFQDVRERYIGASNPQMAFDEKASRFNFQSLHTPEHTGNPVNAGIDEEVPILGVEAGNPVYKINKRLLRTEYCPDLQRYQGFFKYQTNRTSWENSKRQIDPADASKGYVYDVAKEYQMLYLKNDNIEAWSIFDCDCGIFIEDFGLSETDWQGSLWESLGFTYQQFHSNVGIVDRQYRGNDTITQEIGSAFTTYANVEAGDLNKWRVNLFGATLYGNQKPLPLSSSNVGDSHIQYPAITNIQSSSQINAESLPRKMINAYYLIRSNIIGDCNYQGGEDGGQVLPIVYVVNKQNGFGDFYFQGSSQMEFTNTKARTLSEITTSIHNPDMTLAAVSNHSAIIYKITKQIPADLNVAAQIIKSLNLTPVGSVPIKKNVYDNIINE